MSSAGLRLICKPPVRVLRTYGPAIAKAIRALFYFLGIIFKPLALSRREVALGVPHCAREACSFLRNKPRQPFFPASLQAVAEWSPPTMAADSLPLLD